MLIVRTENAVAAWRQTLGKLIREGGATGNSKYFRDEFVTIELSNPSIEPADPLFPMSQDDLDTINRFIISGENESGVIHDWTKIYHHRMFDQPHSQVENMVAALAKDGLSGQALMSLWDKTIDPYQTVRPCTLVIWGRKKEGKLELHVHARASDAYSKLLMNLQEFIALQKYLAGRLNMPPGKYYHVIDSCHIHSQDEASSKALLNKFPS